MSKKTTDQKTEQQTVTEVARGQDEEAKVVASESLTGEAADRSRSINDRFWVFHSATSSIADG